MYNIAVCDDSMIQQSMIKDEVMDYIQGHNMEAEVDLYGTGEQLLGAIEQGKKYDLFILDIILLGLKGNEIAAKLRERGEKGFIMFYTATRAYENIVQECAPAEYLLKPLDKVRFDSIMDKAFEG